MFAFFVLFAACWVIMSVLWRLISGWTAGTPVGAAVAYVH